MFIKIITEYWLAFYLPLSDKSKTAKLGTLANAASSSLISRLYDKSNLVNRCEDKVIETSVPSVY